MGGGWSVPLPDRCPPGKDPVTLVQEAGWASGPFWTNPEMQPTRRVSNPDRPGRCKSLRKLCYPGCFLFLKIHFNIIFSSSYRSLWLSLLFAFFDQHFHTVSSTTIIPTQPSSSPILTPKCKISKNLLLYTKFYFSELWKSSAGDCKVSWLKEWAINRPVFYSAELRQTKVSVR
jgi:hypothetical protein